MGGVFADLSDAGLARVIDDSLQSWFRTMHGCAGVTTTAHADHVTVMSPVPFPLFNSVVHARLDAGDLDARVAAILEPFTDAGLPHMWWVTPRSAPNGLGAALLRRGFFHAETETNMAVDLQALRERDTLGRDATIEVVADETTLEDWVRVTVGGFDMPAFTRDAVAAGLRIALTPGAPWVLYLGRHGGEAVSTSAVLFADGVAGIYWVATLEAARGRGFGTALTQAPLRLARDRGYRVGILQATPMGRPIYERLGFRAFGALEQYVRIPAAQA